MKHRVKDLQELMKQNGIEGGSMMIKQEPVSYTHLTLPTIYSV